MKILVPLNNENDIIRFRDAGAHEFYLGFHDDSWHNRFGEFADINRMSGFKKLANNYSFQGILQLIPKINAAGVASFVTFNANAYSRQQIDFISHEYFPQLKQCNLDGVILSDLSLIRAAIKHGLSPVGSTMLGIYNSDIAKFYRDEGVSRIILPRDLSLDEITSISAQVPDVEKEVFFMRNGCIFSDCYCLGTHRPECGSTCSFIRKSPMFVTTDLSSFAFRNNVEFNNTVYNHFFHTDACGMCALYRLKEAGISSLKIVGRADNHNSVIKDIQLTKQNISIAASCKSEEEYLNKMAFPDNAKTKCQMGLSCYYPEVRFR